MRSLANTYSLICVAGMFAACLSLLGCYYGRPEVFTQVNVPERRLVQRPLETVEVFLGAPPPRPHQEVGLFEITDDNASTEAMLYDLRLHAALRGCDAVQLTDVDRVGRLQVHVLRGVCDLYTDEPARRAAAAQATPTPWPGQNTPCMSAQEGGKYCARPWVCEHDLCVSPYAKEVLSAPSAQPARAVAPPPLRSQASVDE